MDSAMMLELFGYLGSCVVLVSMLMTSVVRLRVINMIGSIIFTIYAILIHSYPTAFLNGCLVFINIYQLARLHRTESSSYVVQPLAAGEGFSDWFVRKHLDDIRRYFPDADPDLAKDAEGFAVFFEDRAAGIFLGKKTGDRFDILLDYTTPAYRDCSVGAYLYSLLPSYGIGRLLCASDRPEHVQYMKKMGFVLQEDGTYVKDL